MASVKDVVIQNTSGRLSFITETQQRKIMELQKITRHSKWKLIQTSSRLWWCQQRFWWQKYWCDYQVVKNLFKRVKIRPDILENLAYFTQYRISGDDRPDNVAFEVYGDPTLDWVVLLSNNIINIYKEWPLDQQAFDAYTAEKYLDIFTGQSADLLFNGVHHYESVEVRDSNGTIIFPAGLQVDNNQGVTFYDDGLQKEITISNVATPITNYAYEEKLNNRKRIINILKPKYLNIVFDDLEEMMQYKEGSTQYVSETLKRGDNIWLYQ